MTTDKASLASTNAWNSIWDEWKDHPELKKVAEEHHNNGNCSASIILNDWIERMTKQYNSGCPEWDCEEQECLD